MSDYRDDLHEIAIASAKPWGGQRALIESVGRAADAVHHGLGTLTTEQATASAEAWGRAVSLLTAQAQITAAALGTRHTRSTIAERARITETSGHRIGTLLQAQASASGAVLDALVSLLTARARAQAVVVGQRQAYSLVTETARTQIKVWQPAHELVEVTGRGTAAAFGRLQRRELVEDAATAQAAVEASQGGSAVLVTARARANSAVVDLLAASDIVVEVGEIRARVLQEHSGSAWTANVGNWATSRYAPFDLDGLVVVEGVVYGSGPNGLYALGAADEDIDGEVEYAPLDLSGGTLVHPLYLPLEYELDGSAELEVRQTHGGQLQAYTYALPAAPADALTSGRFIFGRGLRGRHFGMLLRLQGRRALINDMSVVMAPSKRRV